MQGSTATTETGTNIETRATVRNKHKKYEQVSCFIGLNDTRGYKYYKYNTRTRQY